MAFIARNEQRSAKVEKRTEAKATAEARTTRARDMVRHILHDRLVKNQQRLLELSQLQQRIQKALAFCELAPANFSNEDLLRHLIECVGKTPENRV